MDSMEDLFGDDFSVSSSIASLLNSNDSRDGGRNNDKNKIKNKNKGSYNNNNNNKDLFAIPTKELNDIAIKQLLNEKLWYMITTEKKEKTSNFLRKCSQMDMDDMRTWALKTERPAGKSMQDYQNKMNALTKWYESMVNQNYGGKNISQQEVMDFFYTLGLDKHVKHADERLKMKNELSSITTGNSSSISQIYINKNKNKKNKKNSNKNNNNNNNSNKNNTSLSLHEFIDLVGRDSHVTTECRKVTNKLAENKPHIHNLNLSTNLAAYRRQVILDGLRSYSEKDEMEKEKLQPSQRKLSQIVSLKEKNERYDDGNDDDDVDDDGSNSSEFSGFTSDADDERNGGSNDDEDINNNNLTEDIIYTLREEDFLLKSEEQKMKDYNCMRYSMGKKPPGIVLDHMVNKHKHFNSGFPNAAINAKKRIDDLLQPPPSRWEKYDNIISKHYPHENLLPFANGYAFKSSSHGRDPKKFVTIPKKVSYSKPRQDFNKIGASSRFAHTNEIFSRNAKRAYKEDYQPPPEKIPTKFRMATYQPGVMSPNRLSILQVNDQKKADSLRRTLIKTPIRSWDTVK